MSNKFVNNLFTFPLSPCIYNDENNKFNNHDLFSWNCTDISNCCKCYRVQTRSTRKPTMLRIYAKNFVVVDCRSFSQYLCKNYFSHNQYLCLPTYCKPPVPARKGSSSVQWFFTPLLGGWGKDSPSWKTTPPPPDSV